jgi:dynein heavy chain
LDQPETSDFPSGYTQKAKNFQKLMLLRCFRVDRVYRAVINYISEIMGEEYVRPPFLRLVDSNWNWLTTTSTVDGGEED